MVRYKYNISIFILHCTSINKGINKHKFRKNVRLDKQLLDKQLDKQLENIFDDPKSST